MKEKTQVIAEKDKQELFIIREFDIPRNNVFQAFTDPEILVQFLLLLIILCISIIMITEQAAIIVGATKTKKERPSALLAV